MSNFFAMPTDVWGDDAVALTPTGLVIMIIIMVAVFLAAMFLSNKKKGVKVFNTKQLVFAAMAIALAMVTSMIKVFSLPMGGAVTLCSMLFIVLVGYWYGPTVGISTGIAYGLLQFILEPIFYTLPQMIVDYPLAFGALGIAGFFMNKKNGLTIGYIAGVIGRFVFAFISGLVFFGSYAPEGTPAAIYSLTYNGSYLLAEAVITLIIINLPPVKNALLQVKKTATN